MQNVEARNEQRRRHYRLNAERFKAVSQAFHAAHREEVLAKMRQRRVAEPARTLLHAARKRATALDLPFNLTLADVVVPSHCPVLGIPLKTNAGKCGPNSPSLDRIRPQLGYMRGNVIVISHRANTIKSDATLKELASVLDFYAPILGKQRRSAK